MFRPEEAGAGERDSTGSGDLSLKKKRLPALYDRLITVEDAGVAERLWREIDAYRQ